MAREKKRLAVIGLGSQSRSELIPAILKLADKCEIVAVCDINEDFVRLALGKIPNSSEIVVYKDYKHLFSQVGKKGDLHLNGIVLSVPHFLHGEIVKSSLKKGIAVFKEKPFAFNLKEAKEINSLAVKEGVQLYTVTKRQFYPSYSMGLQFLHDRAIGTPYMYSARHFMANGNLYDGWRSSVQTAGGGVVIDLGYHLLDVILRYFGEATQVNLHWTNTAKPHYSYEVEDAAIIHNWHPIGVQGILQLAALSGPKEELIEIRGTEGRMVVTKKDITIYNVEGEEKDHYSCETNSIDAVVEALEEFLLFDKSIWSQNITHNMQIMRVISMAYKRRFK
jgi:predicted dehydrogenase